MRMTEEKLLEYINEYFEYDPINGGFKYKKVPRGLSLEWFGKRVGNLHPVYGYQGVKIKGRIWREHILIFLFHNGKLPTQEIDHVNRVYSDNRIENLREASRNSNCSNRTGWGTHSKYKGVHRRKRGKPWAATITINKKTNWLGAYASEIEAAIAYDRAALQNNPEFCNLNFPKENYNEV